MVITVVRSKKRADRGDHAHREQRDVREVVLRVQSAEHAEEHPVAGRVERTREPPSRPANTEPNAVTTISTVTSRPRCGPRIVLEHQRGDRGRSSATSCHGTTPSDADLQQQVDPMMPRIEKTIERGIVRPGSLQSRRPCRRWCCSRGSRRSAMIRPAPRPAQNVPPSKLNAPAGKANARCGAEVREARRRSPSTAISMTTHSTVGERADRPICRNSAHDHQDDRDADAPSDVFPSRDDAGNQVAEVLDEADDAGGHDQRDEEHRAPDEEERHQPPGAVLERFAQIDVGPPAPGMAAPSSAQMRPSASARMAPMIQPNIACGPPIVATIGGNRDERADAAHLGHVDRGRLKRTDVRSKPSLLHRHCLASCPAALPVNPPRTRRGPPGLGDVTPLPSRPSWTHVVLGRQPRAGRGAGGLRGVPGAGLPAWTDRFRTRRLGARAAALDRRGRRRDQLSCPSTADALTWVALAAGAARLRAGPRVGGARRAAVAGRARGAAARRSRGRAGHTRGRARDGRPDRRLGRHARTAAGRRHAARAARAGSSRWPSWTPWLVFSGSLQAPNAVLVAAAPGLGPPPAAVGGLRHRRPGLRRLLRRGGRRRDPGRRARRRSSRPPPAWSPCRSAGTSSSSSTTSSRDDPAGRRADRGRPRMPRLTRSRPTRAPSRA